MAYADETPKSFRQLEEESNRLREAAEALRERAFSSKVSESSEQESTAPRQSRSKRQLIERAWDAYLRKMRYFSEPLMKCCKASSFVQDQHIVLRSPSETVAVFRIVHRGMRLLEPSDWPEEFR